MALLQAETITPPVFATVTGVAVFAIAMLGVVGEFSRKVIGIVYSSPDNNSIVVSHVNFFGNRKDICYDVKEIIPLNDTSEISDDVFWKIYTYSSPDNPSFYITTRYGGIRNKKIFDSIFYPL